MYVETLRFDIKQNTTGRPINDRMNTSQKCASENLLTLAKVLNMHKNDLFKSNGSDAKSAIHKYCFTIK